jgi:hypothetical protein
MERIRRTSATAVTALTTIALFAGPAGAAVASPDPAPAPARPAAVAGPGEQEGPGALEGPQSARPDGPVRAIGIVAAPETGSVRAWQEFRVVGSAAELRPGTRIALQQRRGERWVTLPASMETARDGSFALRVALGIKGPNTLRVVGGGQASAPFTVAVR